MHGKFPAIQQNHQNSILFHETIPLIDIKKYPIIRSILPINYEQNCS
jgi:hypothetical protein